MIICPSAHGALGALEDANFASVIALLHFDNDLTNKASLGPALWTNGTAHPTLSSTQSLYGGFSEHFTGITQVVLGNNSIYSLGTGDFCIELAVYLASVTTAQNLIDFRTNASGNQPCPTIYVTGGTIRYFSSNADRITSGAAAISVNTWTRIALARVSGTSRLFIEGTQAGSNFSDSTNVNGALCTIPSSNAVAGIVDGYVDEVRITKGAGRYTANYSVATAAFPNG